MSRPDLAKRRGGACIASAAALSLGLSSKSVSVLLESKIDENLKPDTCPYCNSLSTSCCTLLAWANAAMPVWLRISNFDMFEVAEA
jgi:hypothetical protein